MTTFADIVGQPAVVAHLQSFIDSGRVPHALLFAGPAGTGKLPTALAMGAALLCQHPVEGSVAYACGQCTACKMVAQLAHPDLHFSFPVYKPAGQNDPPISDQFVDQWREMMLKEGPYLSLPTWQQCLRSENKQLYISVRESDQILRKLSIASSQGGYRVIIIWQAETLREDTANKLLKILEEPPSKTVFILTTDHPDSILQTIRSRSQRIDFPPIRETDIAAALQTKRALSEEDARLVARLSEGSYTAALASLGTQQDRDEFFAHFVSLMRLCYGRKVTELARLADELAGWGRERQKNFLQYCQRMVRENFAFNFRLPQLCYLQADEAQFSSRFARFINERNVEGIAKELERAETDIERNVNARMVFFDLMLKTIVLLRK